MLNQTPITAPQTPVETLKQALQTRNWLVQERGEECVLATGDVVRFINDIDIEYQHGPNPRRMQPWITWAQGCSISSGATLSGNQGAEFILEYHPPANQEELAKVTCGPVSSSGSSSSKSPKKKGTTPQGPSDDSWTAVEQPVGVPRPGPRRPPYP
jgi:hypothetical protein